MDVLFFNRDAILKEERKVGLDIRRVARVALIVLGIFDTLTHWTVWCGRPQNPVQYNTESKQDGTIRSEA